MTNMIERVMEKVRDEEAGSLEECITEACLTYESIGELFTELLSYHGGKYDGKAMTLLEDMIGEYMDGTR